MTAVLAHSHGAPTGSPSERFTSRNPDDFALPSTAQEEWRFTPLARIRDAFTPYRSAGSVTVTVDAPAGVAHSRVGRDHPLFGTVAEPADRVAALALAGVEQALLVETPVEAQVERPIVIDVVGAPGLNYGHVIVHAGRHSKSTVVFNHSGSTTDTANVEFVVE